MVSVNSSFDAGVLRVCYHGKNRNRSEINKEIFEKCINTIYNCPIVCNYIREEEEIGSHDVEVVKTSKGLKLVNITTPVGVVPTGANYWWEEVEEENGVVHEYLCVDVLIWKRQEAYSKLKENGITDESMEITVKDGEMIDGYYRVYDFEFTAFCLLGTAEPCFESASVRLFEKDEFVSQYSLMMADLKEEIAKVQPANAVGILHPQNFSEGGNETLDKKLELLAKYNLTVDMLDFNIEDFELDELEQKFEEIKNAAEGNDGGQDGADNTPTDGEGNGEGNGEGEKPENYALTAEQFRSGLIEALSAERMMSSWGEEIPRYIYVDYDTEVSEVYCYDYEDWKLYGFTYTTNGDVVTVNFADKKRKKFSIVDFDEGDTDLGFAHVYESISDINHSQNKAEFETEKGELEAKYSEATNTIDSLNTEIAELRKFKEGKLKDERDEAEEAVFSEFEDLTGVEAFETLRENAGEYSIEDLEEKCFAIRGRKNSNMNFSTQRKTPKLPAHQHNKDNDEPYEGLFLKYGSRK